MEVAPDVEVLVCTLGTRGDILPFMALASPFLKRGYKVTVLTNRNWRNLVEEQGATFFEIALEDPSQSGRSDGEFYRTHIYPSFSRSFSFVESKARDTNCVLIYRLNMLGMECAAERFKLPNIKIALQPAAIRSVERPAWPLTRLTQGLMGRIHKQATIPAFYGLNDIFGRYRNYSNSFRKSVSLAPLRLGKYPNAEDVLFVLCPDWFATPQTDWPRTHRALGFPFLDMPFRDDALSAFLSSNDAPVVFTPGTGVTDVEAFFERADSVCRILKAPGVFLSSSLARLGRHADSRIFASSYAELDWLLPRARLIVHHGGIGTIAQAVRAAVPQIILPDRFDQPDNALRVSILGLGGTFLSRSPSAEEIATMAKDIIASTTVRKQLEIASALVARYDASQKAFDMTVSLLRKHNAMRQRSAA